MRAKVCPANVLKDRSCHYEDRKMGKIALAVLLAALSLSGPLAFGEDKAADVTDMQTLRAAVKADKRSFVASTMKLTDAEAKRFWPIYDSYQRNIDLNSRRRVIAVEGLLFRDQPMTNLAAKNLVTEMMAIDDAE